MFPSTHDITPANLPLCVAAMDAMLDHGHSLLVVSKPHVDCIEAICGRYMDERTRILFRFTIGSRADDVLSFWEPAAPSFMERLDSLCLAAERGFQTSVSCEPMLDDNVEAVVDQVLPFVTDAVWIGKANRLRARLLINGADPEVMLAGERLIASQNDTRIRDLYSNYKSNRKIKWKESIKNVVGIPMAVRPGMDT
jgi:DNA repair photolyase